MDNFEKELRTRLDSAKSESQKLRFAIYEIFAYVDSDLNFEEFYKEMMNGYVDALVDTCVECKRIFEQKEASELN